MENYQVHSLNFNLLMGYLAAFSVLVLYGIGIYSFGYAVKNSSLLFVLLLECLFGLLLIFPMLLFMDNISVKAIFQNANAGNWLWLSIASITGVVGGNYFSLLNLKTAGEKINSLLSPAITAFSIVLSYLFLSEEFSLFKIFGVLITLGSVVFFLLQQQNKSNVKNAKLAAFSGITAIICISLTIICSIKGAANQVTFLHAIWLKLLVGLPFIFAAFFLFNKKFTITCGRLNFYGSIFCGIICQTILAGYLWFYASFSIGVSVFQIVLATLPLCVYAVDVYVLKKSKASPFFLLAAVFAAAGICLAML